MPRGPMGFLTPDQRLMHFADTQKATASMTADAARDFRFKQRDKIMAMNANERAAYTADLTKRWNALAPDARAKIKTDADAWYAQRPMGRGDGGGRGGWGGGPDCPPAN
jgi:hypothetical protein